MKTLKTPKHKIAPKKTAKIFAAIKAYEADGDCARIADYDNGLRLHFKRSDTPCQRKQ